FYYSRGLGIGLAIIAALTDYLDGAIARATGQVTFLGEVLDHFCDLCFESLVLLIAVSGGFFPPIVLFIYLLREFWVSGMRRFVARTGQNIPSNVIGKLKTNLLMWGFLPTMVSVGGLLPRFEPALGNVGRVMIGIGLLFSYVSALRYTRSFFEIYDR